METHIPTRASRKEWIALAVLALPTLLLSIDISVLFLALAPMSKSLGANTGQQLWIMDIYGFMISGFLVTMGTAGDKYGYRKVLSIGAAGFGLSSVLAAFSHTAGMLIFARALMGITGATLMPCTLALIRNMFRDPHQRSMAISLWISCFMVGNIAGPLVGGIVLQHFQWGAVFLLGVPVMVILLIAAPFLLPDYREDPDKRKHMDPLGVACSLAAILPFIYGFTEISRKGWDLIPILSILVGLIFGVVFVYRERRLSDPLVDLSLFSSKTFSVTLLIMLLTGIFMGGTFLYLIQYLEMIIDLPPLQAGYCMIPQAIFMIIGSFLSPVMARRTGPGYVVCLGLCFTTLGFALLTQVTAGGSPFIPMVAFSLMSLGVSPIIGLGTDIVIGSAPPDKAGSAASLSETVNELGVALGIALLGSIGALIYRIRLAGPGMEAAREGIAKALVLPLPPSSVMRVKEAFTSGFRGVAFIGMLGTIGQLLIAWITLRRTPKPGGQH